MNNEENVAVEETPVVDAETLIEDAQIAEAIEERHEAIALPLGVAGIPVEAVPAAETPDAKFESYVEALAYFAYKVKEVAPAKPAIINAIAKLEQAINELK